MQQLLAQPALLKLLPPTGLLRMLLTVCTACQGDIQGRDLLPALQIYCQKTPSSSSSRGGGGSAAVVQDRSKALLLLQVLAALPVDSPELLTTAVQALPGYEFDFECVKGLSFETTAACVAKLRVSEVEPTRLWKVVCWLDTNRVPPATWECGDLACLFHKCAVSVPASLVHSMLPGHINQHLHAFNQKGGGGSTIADNL